MQGSADALVVSGPRRRAGRPWGLLGLVSLAFALVPRRLALVVGALIGFAAGSVLRIRRALVEDSMRAAGISVDDKGPFAAAMYRALGASLAELLWMVGRGGWAHPAKLARFDPKSRARFDRALARGRGVVLATAHTGNWELAAAAIAEEHALAIVAKPMSVRFVDRFLRRAREASGIRVIAPRGAMRAAMETLREGGIVGMMIDQVPTRRRHALQMDFLCGTCDVDRAPAALASRMGAPLVVAVGWRDDDSRHVLEVLDVLEPPPDRPRKWVDEATRESTRLLDKFVHRHPPEWMWLHRRWRRAPK